jgi:hypothetical protein
MVITLTLAIGNAGAISFSVDFQGPTAGFVPGPFSGVPDAFAATRIDEGAILTTGVPGPLGPNPPALGPLPPPGIMVTATAGPLGTYPGGLGIVPGLLGGVELDALSYGVDFLPDASAGIVPEIYFSVDEFATGIAIAPGAPNVTTEGAFGTMEASADVFRFLGPIVPPGPIFGNTSAVDGNGLIPTGLPGVGLVEPNPPTPFTQDPGDNLDAVDMDTRGTDMTGRIYFSLDSDFPDPLEGFPVNTATALGNGFVGGDVLVSTVGGAPALYAPAGMLGLDMLGFDTDDLDALALWDNGDGVFTPGIDDIAFSVRRGSAIIGAPDSAFGLPIEEGDILTIPAVPGGLPAVLIPAEALGLATFRSFGGGFNGHGDELDALDMIVPVPEPTTVTLLLLGSLAGLKLRRRL